MDMLAPLHRMRAHAGARRTIGLDDKAVAKLALDYDDLQQAILAAASDYEALRLSMPELLELDEDTQVREVQKGFGNFYAADAVNPYVALLARGPWIVTLKGAVIYDCGGYGILGFGHTPRAVIDALGRPQTMANIMTPTVSQLRFGRAIRREIGHTRGGGQCPYSTFMCLNSGSEANSLAARIADVNTKVMTDPGGKYPGFAVKRVVMKGSFHGRTERPALYSDSSRATYEKHLASFRGEDSVIVVPTHDVAALESVFAEATRNRWFIEAMFLEPVMGEGDPGRALPREFYAAARRLTAEHGALLLIDSIQAGLRAHGVLSIVDYPGFQDLAAPDLETYSKALNAGQFPLSVLALNDRAAGLYRAGTYGNTMTTNARGLDVACAVLGSMTPEVRSNIRERGEEALTKLRALQATSNGGITKVQGTGLLFSCELGPDFKCHGAGSTEEWLREQGLGVIHGGQRSLRFTPRFEVTSEELDLVVSLIGRALKEGPRRAAPPQVPSVAPPSL